MSEHHFPSFQVQAEGFVPVAPPHAWRVLTDYERLPEFVPDLVRSTVLSRGPQEATLEQVSRTGVLFMSHTVRMVVHLAEQPYAGIDVTLVSGDMQHYTARWTLEPIERAGSAGTLIRYCADLTPAFYLPPLIGQPLVQTQVRRMVAAVLARIETCGDKK